MSQGVSKNFIILNGKNYYPSDLGLTALNASNLLCKSGAIAFGIEKDCSEEVVIVLESKSKDNNTNKDIINLVKRAILQSYQINLNQIVIVPPKSIPKTTSGKVQRQLCKKLYLEKKLVVLFS